MKKSIVIPAALLMAFVAAAKDSAPQRHTYLDINDVANSVSLLPPPPAFGSEKFVNDSIWYEWGKLQRNTPRGELAAADADVSMNGIVVAMSDAFGMEISKANTPQLYKLLDTMREDAGDLSTRLAKQNYKRQRPYVHFNEPTCRPDHEEGLRNNGSFPSGHTSIGWAVALVLAEINPANQDAILKRGYEMGESRIICGFHYRSDVDAGRIAAAAVVARLHADKAFSKQLKKAKKEITKKLAQK
jgi:acid phosphatase (class A)